VCKAGVLETKNKEIVRRGPKKKVLEIEKRSEAEKVPEMNTHRDREREKQQKDRDRGCYGNKMLRSV
jgi:hypothetical protein